MAEPRDAGTTCRFAEQRRTDRGQDGAVRGDRAELRLPFAAARTFRRWRFDRAAEHRQSGRRSARTAGLVRQSLQRARPYGPAVLDGDDRLLYGRAKGRWARRGERPDRPDRRDRTDAGVTSGPDSEAQ